MSGTDANPTYPEDGKNKPGRAPGRLEVGNDEPLCIATMGSKQHSRDITKKLTATKSKRKNTRSK
jgi:hypothetical protein